VYGERPVEPLRRDQVRLDLAATTAAKSELVGSAAPLGGLLRFGMAAQGCEAPRLEPPDSSAVARNDRARPIRAGRDAHPAQPIEADIVHRRIEHVDLHCRPARNCC
jgi:hypothetical protein